MLNKNTYLTAMVEANSFPESKQLIEITDKLYNVLCIVPALQVTDYAFIEAIKDGLEKFMDSINQGKAFDELLEKKYKAMKVEAEIMVEAYESDDVQTLLKEDKNVIMSSSNNEDYQLNALAYTMLVYETFKKKQREISELRAEVSKGA